MMKKKSNFKNENNQFKNKIVEATLRGDINEIKDMIDNGEDINSFDQFSRTALLNACSKRYNEIVLYLLQSGAYVDYIGIGGITPLIEATSKGYTEIVSYLLEFNATVDIQDSCGYTALMFATNLGNVIIVSKLLQAGCNVNLHNYSEQHNALMYACRKGYLEIIKLLLPFVSNILALDHKQNTALYYTLAKSYWECSEYILDYYQSMNSKLIDESVLNLMNTSNNSFPKHIKDKLYWMKYRKNWLEFVYSSQYITSSQSTTTVSFPLTRKVIQIPDLNRFIVEYL